MVKKNRLNRIKNFLKKNLKKELPRTEKNAPYITHLENFLSQKTIDEVSVPRAKIDFIKENTLLKISLT